MCSVVQPTKGLPRIFTPSFRKVSPAKYPRTWSWSFSTATTGVARCDSARKRSHAGAWKISRPGSVSRTLPQSSRLPSNGSNRSMFSPS